MTTTLKGWKTLIFGLFLVIVPAALNYIANIDWISLGISPGVSAMIGAIVIGLRALTNTSMTKGN